VTEGTRQAKVVWRGLLLLALGAGLSPCLLAAEDLVEEFRLIDAIKVDPGAGKARVTLIGAGPGPCGDRPVFVLNMGSSAADTLLSTLIAARLGRRSVTLEFERVGPGEGGCTVAAVTVH
jgi:hypothetical protein